MKTIPRLFLISVILFICYSLFLGFWFPKIEDTIPIHFSGSESDGFGSKWFLWLEVGINALIMVFIGILLNHPQWLLKKDEPYLESSEEGAIKNRQMVLSVISLLATLLFCGASFFSIF